MFTLYLLPLFMGASIASQSAVNTRLKKYTGSPYISSAISFFVGMIFLLGLTLYQKEVLVVSVDEINRIPWWAWIGGFTAAFALTVNVFIFSKLGSVQTSVLPIVGQLIMGVIIDHFGLFHSFKSSLTLTKSIGLLILFWGMMLTTEIITFSGNKTYSDESKNSRLIWQILGIFSGVLIAIQSGTNGYLGRELGSPLRASMISFTIAFVIMVAVSCFFKSKIVSLSEFTNLIRKESWVFAGGLLGSLYVLLSAWLVPLIGTGSVIIIALFGQLLTSVIIQQLGLFHSTVRKITLSQSFGLLMMLLGIIVIRLL